MSKYMQYCIIRLYRSFTLLSNQFSQSKGILIINSNSNDYLQRVFSICVKVTTKHFCGTNLLNVKDAFSQTSDTEKNHKSTPQHQSDPPTTRKRRLYNSRRATDTIFTSPASSVVEGKPFSV